MLNKQLLRKNQMIYVRNKRNELYDSNLEALSDSEILDLYIKVYTEEHTSDKLTFIRFKDDKGQGPYMPHCIFKHKDYEGEFWVTNSYMGADFCLNPGRNVKRGNSDDFGLNSKDMAYIWECFEVHETKKHVVWHD